jgi:uncharacterized protein
MSSAKTSVNCIYIHGFASGPLSTKAEYFSARLREKGVGVTVPNMNGADFADLTITGQLHIIDDAAKGSSGDLLLMGSSMGGLLAVLSAHRLSGVKAVVLLAPGFGLNRRWEERMTREEFSNWQQTGTVDVFHHGVERNLPLKFSFIEDARNYQTDNLQIDVPTLVLHGLSDEVVPIEESERFQALNPGRVEFHKMPSDHAPTDCLPQLWEYTESFLSRHGLV